MISHLYASSLFLVQNLKTSNVNIRERSIRFECKFYQNVQIIVLFDITFGWTILFKWQKCQHNWMTIYDIPQVSLLSHSWTKLSSSTDVSDGANAMPSKNENSGSEKLVCKKKYEQLLLKL